MRNDLFQAYKQAPWRKQLQYLGIFMAALIGFALIAGLYLSISGRTATIGRKVQVLDASVQSLKLNINDMRTTLAEISSAKSMYARIKDLGMEMLNPAEALYVEVPGYVSDQGWLVSSESVNTPRQNPEILPEYTNTLLEWAIEKLNTPLTSGQVQP